MLEEKISLRITQFSEDLNFHLRAISLQDDRDYSQRKAAMADKQGDAKAEAEYRGFVDALAEWSCDVPTRRSEVESEPDPETQERTKEIKNVPLGEGTPKEVVLAFFKTRSRSKEWIAFSLITEYRNRLYPDVSFLPLSE